MVGTVAAVLLATQGCSPATPVIAPVPSDTDHVDAYFESFNEAGRQGTQAQDEFLRSTQHPDFADQACGLSGLVMDVYPALSTVRPDPDWEPEGGGKPAGAVYVVSVSTTVRQNGAMVGEQIGVRRIAVLDGRAYGFAPCAQQN
ncbi:hypothetical protein CFN78_20520 [Amycolatopsis antarctica]|uniref:Uncharacterized protein n=1 Tax=Amycolatopsis antarctica TaxID=1854586 RepID=A0A263D237_9PSEU|nr:hypothetical protein CFN78_20520 [Amycolatopsis antarctica]